MIFKRIIVVLCMIMPALTAYAQVQGSVSIRFLGAKFFNSAGYEFNTPFDIQDFKIPASLSYQYLKGKNGINVELMGFYFGDDYEDSQKNKLYSRGAWFLNLDYIRMLYQEKKFELLAQVGFTSKYSDSRIDIYQGPNARHLYWLDQNSIELGGLGLNLGAKVQYNFSNRFFVDADFKSVNFVLGGKYQRNSLFAQLGIGFKLKKS